MATTAKVSKPSPGRPRDASLSASVIAATLAIVADVGVGGLTTDAVAARAGVSKATMYRRWPSKQALLRDAAATLVSEISVPDSGSLEGDVRALLRAAMRVYREALPGKVIPALVSEMAFDAELARVIREGFLAQRRSAVLVVLGRARERGELRADLDDELGLDLLAGVIYYRFLITGGRLDDALADELTDVLLTGIARPVRRRR